jgi:hypothetical protein
MKTWSRALLIIMLALLPLRGWAQAVMLASGESLTPSLVATAAHGLAAMSETMDMNAHNHMSMSTSPDVDGQPTSDDSRGCGDHAHQLCVVCGMAAASLPFHTLFHTGQVQQPCPMAASSGWHSAEARALLRPPRL